MFSSFDIACQQQALAAAARGQGYVEPNPLVGAVIARDNAVLSVGWHRAFGGPHAEVDALRQMQDPSLARGATLYVTLEPCSHHGKTPPCVDAILNAGIARVVVALVDPFPAVAGSGVERLRAGGVLVEVGLGEDEARALNAPYLTLVEHSRPWTIAKWAMTLDGKLASATGDSQWISSAESRVLVHELRGRMDAIVVGKGTALADDPLLTARPPGARVAARVVLDSSASLPLHSKLVQTAGAIPLLVAVGPQAPADRVAAIVAAGCAVWQGAAADPAQRLHDLWRELGRRRMTNVLVEGGSTLLGALWDARLIDEVHAFIAPKVVGGSAAPSPLGGGGIAAMAEAIPLISPQTSIHGGDVYLRGRVRRSPGGVRPT